MKPHNLLLPVLLLGLLALTGCDSSDPEDPMTDSYPNGQGGASISGAFDASFTGLAFWSLIDTDGNGEMFAAIIIDGDIENIDEENVDALLVIGQDGMPSTGTVDLGVMGNNYGATYLRTRGENQTFVNSVSGSMQISAATSERVAGNLQFSGMAVSFPSGPSGQSSVQAGFNAVYIDEDIVPPGLRPLYDEAMEVAASMQ